MENDGPIFETPLRLSAHHFKDHRRWWAKSWDTRNFCGVMGLVHLRVRDGPALDVCFTLKKTWKQVSAHHFEGFWRWWTKFWKTLQDSTSGDQGWFGLEILYYDKHPNNFLPTSLETLGIFCWVVGLVHIGVRSGLILEVVCCSKSKTSLVPPFLRVWKMMDQVSRHQKLFMR